MTAALFWNLITVMVPILGIVTAIRFPNKLGVKSLLAYGIIRFGALLFMFVCLGTDSFDLSGWYMHAKWMVEQGCFPGKDFLTPYNLGFNALLYLSVFVWKSQFSIIVLFTAVELIALLVLFVDLREIIGSIPAKRVLILYATSPVCLMAYRATQDEPIILLAVAVVLWCVLHARWWWILFASFMAIFCTKLLTPFFLFPFLIAKRWRGVWILVGSLCAYLLLVYAVGVNPLDVRFGRELGVDGKISDAIMDMKTYGNLWAFIPLSSARIPQFICLLALALTSFFCVGGFRLKNFGEKIDSRLSCMLLAVLFPVFVLTYPMTWFSYALPALPFIYMACSDGLMRDLPLIIVLTVWQILFVYTPTESSFLKTHMTAYAAIYFLSFLSILCFYGSEYFKMIRKCKEKMPFRGDPR